MIAEMFLGEPNIVFLWHWFENSLEPLFLDPLCSSMVRSNLVW